MGRIKWVLGLGLIVLLLAGCGAQEPEEPFLGANINGQLDEQAAGERMNMGITAADGDQVTLEFYGAVAQGELRAQLLDAQGSTVWSYGAAPGPFAAHEVLTLRAGEYKYGMAWDGPVQANYAIRWRPGAVEVAPLSPLVLLPGVGMILVALAFVAYALFRRFGWRYLGWGALAWVVTVALKFAWAIPVNRYVYAGLTSALPGALGSGLFYLYVGSLTGVFEVALLWLILRRVRLGRATWSQALAFGLGFGAVEALLLGATSLAGALVGLLAPSLVPAALESLAALNNPLFGLAPVVERLAVVLLHAWTNTLLFYAVLRRESRWFWLAFAVKTLLDTVAAFAQSWGLDQLGRLWAIEGIIVLFGLLSWWGLRWLAPRYAAAETPPPESVPPPAV